MMQLQKQLYEQTMGYQRKEIEFDMSAWSNICLQMDMEQLFTADCFQESELEEYFPSEQWPPSSSSSSQKSLSTSSPENSSPHKLISTSSNPGTLRPRTSYQGAEPQVNNHYYDIKFPTMESEDMAITEAISVILSSSSSSTTSVLDQSQQKVQTSQNQVTCNSGFMPYNSNAPLKFELEKKFCGQKMIKNSIAYLRRMDMMKDGAANQEPQPSRNQLHHMISERKRRVKLNDNFHELRLLLPPSPKKDKASVLCRTKDYLKTLETQIFELERKNQLLEMHQTKEDISRSIHKTNVQIIEESRSQIGMRRINLKITVRLECDLLNLVLHAVEYLKETRVISLVSIDADTCLKQMVQISWATIKFDIKASDWDEITFNKGITRVVDTATMLP